MKRDLHKMYTAVHTPKNSQEAFDLADRYITSGEWYEYFRVDSDTWNDLREEFRGDRDAPTPFPGFARTSERSSR